MIANAIDSGLKLQKLVWLGLVILTAVFLGYFLASNSVMPFLALSGFVCLLILPYHPALSICLSVSTYASAFIMPFFPGRPYLWEFAALLGWTGSVVTVFLRQYAPDSGQRFKENRWLFVGVVGYALVLLVIMFYRGVGFRILGSEQMGGRFYFQQLACAVFPFLFWLHPVSEKTLTRLFTWQCVLTCTYLMSDFAFSKGEFYFLLQFFELPNDAINFELQALNLGIRRYQSFYLVSQGFILLLLTRVNLGQLLTARGFGFVPLVLALLGLGLLGGHRYLPFILGVTLLFCAISQRFFNVRNTLMALAVLGAGLFAAYSLADRLPLAAQRAISFFPGIEVSQNAKQDASSTLEMRRVLRKLGMEMSRDYFWVGRGFGQSAMGDYSLKWDPTGVTTHLNQGKFYNGFVGLMVNTGVFGTFFMLLILGSGSVLAWRIMRHLRSYGCADTFSRVCSLVTSLWTGNAVAFLFLHGDSEFAMKTFSLQAGMLLACHACLKERLTADAAPSA
ncbi:MAG: hypothetical protein HY674_08550 [Chloroflexi bacterium]|nr:hypothetical protein [Chloroflexota bacterium]